jgi:hypothetical protein
MKKFSLALLALATALAITPAALADSISVGTYAGASSPYFQNSQWWYVVGPYDTPSSPAVAVSPGETWQAALGNSSWISWGATQDLLEIFHQRQMEPIHLRQLSLRLPVVCGRVSSLFSEMILCRSISTIN